MGASFVFAHFTHCLWNLAKAESYTGTQAILVETATWF
jgi:hypothetical protein